MLPRRKAASDGITTLKQRDKAVRELRRADLALRAAVLDLQKIGLSPLLLYQGHAIDLAELEIIIQAPYQRRGAAENAPP